MNRQITIITPGRFHSFDLAAQVQANGRLAAIYTGYPRFKLKNTGVDPRFIRSFPWFQTPYMGLTRIPAVPRRVLREIAWRGSRALAAYAARTLPECGCVVGLSGSGLKSGRVIKARGGVFVCDRGSSHIEWQNRIVTEEYERVGLRWIGVDPRVIEVERAEYELADAITIPSTYAMRSFVAMGVAPRKLRVIPYGVNLAAYRRTAERAPNFRILFVGGLVVAKGIHYLLEAFRRANLPGAELVLVGGRSPDTEALLARSPVERLTLTGVLPRAGVIREMSRASVLVHPSIDEGLALVQAQALACGCPVIGTMHSGAEDLFTDGREGFIVAPRDVDALVERLERLYRDPALRESMAAAALDRVRSLGGWDRYGRSMLTLFDELLANAGSQETSARAAFLDPEPRPVAS